MVPAGDVVGNSIHDRQTNDEIHHQFKFTDCTFKVAMVIYDVTAEHFRGYVLNCFCGNFYVDVMLQLAAIAQCVQQECYVILKLFFDQEVIEPKLLWLDCCCRMDNTPELFVVAVRAAHLGNEKLAYSLDRVAGRVFRQCRADA